MEKKQKEKISSNFFEVVFEMVSFIDEMDRQKLKEQSSLKISPNMSINNLDKTNKR